MPHRVSLWLLGLMFTLPFLIPVHLRPLTLYRSEWFALALGLAAMGMLGMRRLREDVRLPVLALVPVAFAGLLGTQACIGLVPYAGQVLVAAGYLLWSGGLIVVAAVLERELGMRAVTRHLAWALVVGGALSASAALAQHYDLAFLLDSLVSRKTASGVYGNVAQQNLFADYVTLALMSVGYLLVSGAMAPIAGLCLAVPMLYVLGLSGSRSVWMYLLFAWGLASVSRYRLRDAHWTRPAFFYTGLLLVGFYVVQQLARLSEMAPAGGLMTTVNERMFGLATGESGVDTRLQLWREAWWMFTQAPVLGTGWGGFPWGHFEYQSRFGADAASGPYNQAHNLVMQLLAETGMVGVLTVLCGIWLWVRSVRRSTFTVERHWQVAVLGVLVLHSLHEFPLWYAHFLGIASLICGLGGQTGTAVPVFRALRPALLGTMSIAAVYLLWHAHVYLDFERAYAKSWQDLPAEERRRGVGRALADPTLRPYGELAVAFSLEVSPERLPEKLELVGRATRFAPFETIVYKEAALYALAGMDDAAVLRFQSASRTYPAELFRVREELSRLALAYPERFAVLIKLVSGSTNGEKRPSGLPN